MRHARRWGVAGREEWERRKEGGQHAQTKLKREGGVLTSARKKKNLRSTIEIVTHGSNVRRDKGGKRDKNMEGGRGSLESSEPDSTQNKRKIRKGSQ